jgi:hypothetical protein
MKHESTGNGLLSRGSRVRVSAGVLPGPKRLSPEIRFRMFVDDRNALGCHHWIGAPRRLLEMRRYALGLSDAPRYTRVVAKCGSPSCVRKEHLAVRR